MNKKCDDDLFVLHFDLYVHVVLQIEPLFNFLLYVEFVVVVLMILLIVVQLFDDVLLSIAMTTTLMSCGWCYDYKYNVN
jgi:hypothetical protein